jgi:hypothetical protein
VLTDLQAGVAWLTASLIALLTAVYAGFSLVIAGVVIAFAALVFGVLAWLGRTYLPAALSLDLVDPPYGHSDEVNGKSLPSRFYHIAVSNSDKSRVARNCVAYVLSLKDIRTHKEHVLKTMELKWEGYREPSATILPRSHREFDAFWIHEAVPDRLLLNAFIDSSKFLPKISGQVDILATFVVVCDNFRTATRKFLIHLDPDVQEVSMRD